MDSTFSSLQKQMLYEPLCTTHKYKGQASRIVPPCLGFSKKEKTSAFLTSILMLCSFAGSSKLALSGIIDQLLKVA